MFYNGFYSPNPCTSPAHCLTPAPSSYTIYNSSHPPFGIKVPAQVVTSRRYVFEVSLRVNPRVIAPEGKGEGVEGPAAIKGKRPS